MQNHKKSAKALKISRPPPSEILLTTADNC